MLRAAPSVFVCVGFSLLLNACQSAPFSYAYYNDRKDTVTIVEHRGTGVETMSLDPQVRLFPMESVPSRIEFSSRSGRQFAVFTREDYNSLRDPSLPPLLVISGRGVAFASRAFLDKMDREWEPAQHPSRPVSFS